MQRAISDSFTGFLNLKGEGQGCDSTFNINGNIVTIIPLTDDCLKEVSQLSYTDGSNDKDHWIYGFAEDNCSVAILKKTRLRGGFSSGVDLKISKFKTPLILKSTITGIVDLKTFDSIEFYGGIVNVLHTPALAIKEKYSENMIIFNEESKFKKSYDVEINGEKFEIEYSISFADLNMETGKVPDLRNSVHATLRFKFNREQQLCDFEKYYSYAMNIFQFCTGRLNVRSEIRLYKNKISGPILVRINDGFDDYSNDVLDFMKVIRLGFLDEKLPVLAKILNEKKTQPYLLFLPQRNKYINNITYTNVTDLCIAFEREYSFLETNSKKKEVEAAKALTEELLQVIDNTTDCPDAVKIKAKNILNSQLKSFSPSLKEKIISIYERFEEDIKSITEQKDHDIYGISKSYSKKEFNKKVSDFIGIRNKASHTGVIWNDGAKIFVHLKILIYFSVLNRIGISPKESSGMLSWLYGWYF